jgi:hypothetical protein
MTSQLKGKIKKFNQKLYNKYDTPARELMKEKLGNIVSDNPDIYAEDMLLNHHKYKFIELQVCADWIEAAKYPYPEPFVFERKGHFSDDTLYIIFDRHFYNGLLFDKKSLEPEPVRTKKYSRYYIYPVQWKNVLRFTVDDLNIDLIDLYSI